MIARISLALLCATLLTGTVMAKDKSGAKPEQVACQGIYGPDSSEALLIETFGKENVETGMVYGPEGMEIHATTVFGDDPDRTMEFGWWDETDNVGLSYVELSPAQTAPGGVRIGMSVDDVAAINGEPFNVGGFGWDYGGYAQIESGTLAQAAEGGCYLSIRFSTREDLGDLDITPISGEISIPSDEPMLQEAGVTVQSLTLGYPDPNYVEEDGAE